MSWLLSLGAGVWAKVAAVGAIVLAVTIAIARVFGAGKKAQQAADAKVTTDILEKQREIAASPPVGSDVIRQRMRDRKF